METKGVSRPLSGVHYKSSLHKAEEHVVIRLSFIFPQSLLDMHKTSDAAGDPQFCDFIESEYLEEQVEAIKEFGDLITRMRRAGEGLGVHLIDRELDS